MRRILVFSLALDNKSAVGLNIEDLVISKWSPSLFKVFPPNTSMKYIFFWVADFLRIFKTRTYCSYQIIEDDHILSSLVCVPSFCFWPFMEKNDIQIKNVFTHPLSRGKGYALKLLNFIKVELNSENRTLWYMTHDKNFPSISLCEKAGFVFRGYYSKDNNIFSFGSGRLIEN